MNSGRRSEPALSLPKGRRKFEHPGRCNLLQAIDHPGAEHPPTHLTLKRLCPVGNAPSVAYNVSQITDKLSLYMDTCLTMRIRTSSVRAIVVVFTAALLISIQGCADDPVAPAQPAAAELIEDAGSERSGNAPSPSATTQPTLAPTTTPEPSPTPSPTPRPGLPVQLRIPSIGIDAYIEHVGLTEDLAMDVPSTVENVAWYKLGYRPGERGNTVIAGHLDTVTGAPAVFWDLESLEPGDEISVLSLDGIERRYTVDFHTRYPYDEAPVQKIFGPASKSRLALITCKGTWDRINRNYSHRVVLYATAAKESAGNQ
ncbi:MAG: hypothetical protein MAG451_01202 [Anaerolineales bacterium]|nr:hypothetical protein [Anaerolineales bacterium]